MKRPLSLGILLFALCALPASAVLDTNNNELSDLWERTYNGGSLFSTGFDPLSDDDGDGWTNAKEAAAGTDPFEPNPPDGLIRPESEYIPEFWADVNDDNELELVSAAIRITWPTIPGKLYTLLYSPDLVDWLPVPDEAFIGSGSVVDYYFTLDEDVKLFWRVAIEDVDSDSDGLTNAEEAALGTNPNNAQTLSGYDDLWLATNFTEMLLNGQFAVIDTDGDGLTNAQEAFLGTNPNVSDNPGIVQESIRNGDFSIPSMDNQDGLNKDVNEPGWNYWAGLPELPNAHSWTAVIGTKIEYQIKEPINTDNPYCELKAEPEDHYGIKQQVGTRIGITYLLALDCKARQNTAPANNEFSVKIDGSTIQSITPTSTWTTRGVSFKATNVITEISLVPTDAANPNDKMGCLVDNVKLVSVDITVRKITDSTPPTDGVIAKVGDAIEFKISDSLQADFPVSAQNIKWYQKQLVADGTYTEWQDIGQDARGTKFGHAYSEGGIFSISCEITIDTLTIRTIYIRKKDNTMSRYDPDDAGEALQEEMKKGAPDAIGICDTQKQLDIRYHAKINLNSTYYDQKNNIYPVGAGYHCNIFVAHKAGDAGAIVPWFNGTIYSYPPAANQWAGVPADAANGHPAYEFNFTNWPLLSSNSYPQPGMVAGKGNYSWSTGHCGIVDYDGQWISASGTKVHRHTGFVIGRNTDLSGNRLPAGKRKYTGS